MPIDFCKYAEALGVKTFFAENTAALAEALKAAKQSSVSSLIEIKTLPGSMSHGYNAWWRVGVSPVSNQREVVKAHEDMQAHIDKVRVY